MAKGTDKMPPPRPAGAEQPAGPVLAYRAEAEDDQPPDTRNVLAAAVSILLVLPCTLTAGFLIAFTLQPNEESWKRFCTGALGLASLGAVAGCVAAARHHLVRRPPATFAGVAPPLAEGSSLGPPGGGP